MSGIIGRAFTVGAPLVGLASPFLSDALGANSPLAGLLRQPRKIATIIPDVTVEENFSDRVQVTQHPLASGTPMADHAFRMPRTITMHCGWTNANPLGAALGGAVSGFQSGGGFSDLGGALTGGAIGAGKGLLSSLTEQRAGQIYKDLLKLQYDDTDRMDKVKPFDLTCGKRTYKNVVITEITVRNNHETEYALIADIKMEELIIVSATTANQPVSGVQKMPAKTAPTSDGGTKQPLQSDLSKRTGVGKVGGAIPIPIPGM